MDRRIEKKFPEATDPLPAMLDVEQTAKLLGCSTRHVYRLCDGGKMPRPVKIGALNRWPRAVIEQWITDGCKRVDRSTTLTANRRVAR